MDYLKFIRGFGKINVRWACNMCNVNRSNLIAGFSPKEKEKEVYNRIISEIEFLKKECQYDKKDS